MTKLKKLISTDDIDDYIGCSNDKPKLGDLTDKINDVLEMSNPNDPFKTVESEANDQGMVQGLADSLQNSSLGTESSEPRASKPLKDEWLSLGFRLGFNKELGDQKVKRGKPVKRLGSKGPDGPGLANKFMRNWLLQGGEAGTNGNQGGDHVTPEQACYTTCSSSTTDVPRDHQK